MIEPGMILHTTHHDNHYIFVPIQLFKKTMECIVLYDSRHPFGKYDSIATPLHLHSQETKDAFIQDYKEWMSGTKGRYSIFSECYTSLSPHDASHVYSLYAFTTGIISFDNQIVSLNDFRRVTSLLQAHAEQKGELELFNEHVLPLLQQLEFTFMRHFKPSRIRLNL